MTVADDAVVLQCQDVSFAYKGKQVLRSVTFGVQVGLTFLLGQNGAGKTTLLRLMQGDLLPASGQISGPGGESVGYLPQDLTYPGRMRVGHFCEYSGWLRGLPSRKLKPAATQALGSVGLLEATHQPLRSLSGGMLRRAGIAQALMSEPQLLILDEPTDSLDIRQKRDLRNLLKALSQRKAIVVSTHNLDDLADDQVARVVLLHEGELRFAGTTPDFLMHGGEGSYRSQLENAYLRLTGSLC